MILIIASLISAAIWLITGLFLAESVTEETAAFIIANLWIATGVILSAIEKRGDV